MTHQMSRRVPGHWWGQRDGSRTLNRLLLPVAANGSIDVSGPSPKMSSTTLVDAGWAMEQAEVDVSFLVNR